jgi:hypothetical protein
VVRSAAWTEAAGIPAVAVVCTGFAATARSVSEAEGIPDLRVVEYPPPNISTQSPADVRKSAPALVDEVIETLTGEIAAPGRPAAVEPGPGDIVFKGSFEEVNDLFYDNHWTDGLPVIPPTLKKIQEFLRYTDRSPDEVIGTLPPAKREATIWKVAVNAVMAGCRPEYMPVLTAIAEAVADPRYGIQHAGSTSGWAPLIILNGPVIKQLGFNSGPGVTRPGRRANTTVSRFLRLLMINLSGYLVGITDKATFGQNYFIALAEAEEESPWEPLSADRGFKPDSNIVTVTSAETLSDAFASFGTGEEQLKTIAWQVARELSAVPVILSFGRERSIVVALSPLIANLIGKAGYSKDDVRQYLFKNARMRASEFDMILSHTTACNLVAAGRLEEQFCESTDPDRMIPLVHSPEDFLVIVSGDPARNRSFVTLQGGEQGLATSKEIKLPPNWNQRVPNLVT